jgi:pyruvate ferredoxin oxidoreductase gamma subunit
VRVSEKKIYLKCDIERPNHLVLFDPSLFTDQQISEQVVKGGTILFNTDDAQVHPELQGFMLCWIDALRISKSNGLGSIVNTAVLGAYVGITKIVSVDTLLKVIKENIPATIEKNMKAAKEAYERVAII